MLEVVLEQNFLLQQVLLHPCRYERLYPLFVLTRPLSDSETLYMEPAQLSIPLGELSAAAMLASTRTAFGGGYQILPEAEAPLTALLGRNGVLFGTPVNSKAPPSCCGPCR
jgi:hypothetical protein